MCGYYGKVSSTTPTVDCPPWYTSVGFVEATDRVLDHLHVLTMHQHENAGSDPEVVHLNNTSQIAWSLLQ